MHPPPAPYGQDVFGPNGFAAGLAPAMGQDALGFSSPLSGLQGGMVTLDAGHAEQGAAEAPADPTTPPSSDTPFAPALGTYGGGAGLGGELWGGVSPTPAPAPPKPASAHDSGFGGALGLGLLPEGELGSFGSLQG